MEKPLSDYYNYAGNELGVQSQCKSCISHFNQVRSMAERIFGGGQKAFRRLEREERAEYVETAERMIAMGASFGTAAANELTTREGFLYVITNPAWPGCVKLGRAFNPESRLNGYQTGCPNRDYELHYSVYFTDCHEAEQAVHARLAHLRMEGEWFELSISEAMNALDIIKEII